MGGQSIGHYLHGSVFLLQSKALSDEKEDLQGSDVHGIYTDQPEKGNEENIVVIIIRAKLRHIDKPHIHIVHEKEKGGDQKHSSPYRKKTGIINSLSQPCSNDGCDDEDCGGNQKQFQRTDTGGMRDRGIVRGD